MNMRTFGTLAFLSLAGGIIGGSLPGILVKSDPATAGETPATMSRVAIAEEFRLVDQTGQTRARLGMDA
jgi:hypothetical protein